MKDEAIAIWNNVIDGYEGTSKYRWPDLVKDLQKIVSKYRDDEHDNTKDLMDGFEK